jgi:hypothetical protein
MKKAEQIKTESPHAAKLRKAMAKSCLLITSASLVGLALVG